MSLLEERAAALQAGNVASADLHGRRELRYRLAPAAMGCLLFLLSNLGVIHAVIAPPLGYSAFGAQRHGDIAQYLTWLAGLKTAWILPNYHAPWLTPPGLIVVGLYPAAVLERWFSVKPVVALQLFSLAGYIATAYALAFAYRTFFKSGKQALRALLISLACVPLAALPGLFRVFHDVRELLPILGNSAGVSEFMLASDGFLHGLMTWPLLTYGTCAQILAMSLLARYCSSHEGRWFRWLAVVCFLSALVHPFEIFVTLLASSVVLLQQPEAVALRLKKIAMLFGAGAAGLSPYLIQSFRVPWVREAMNGNRPGFYIAPASLFASLGAPAIAVVLMLLLGFPKSQDRRVLTLKAWFLSTFLIFYIPGIPFALHMLDGVLIAIGMMLAMQIEEFAERRPLLRLPVVRLLAAVVVLWMLFPNITFRVRSWKEGIATPQSYIKFASAIIPNDEVAALEWLRKNAAPSDLVLASAETAPWLAAAPVHSFASHPLFSSLAARPRDAELRRAFFNGQLLSQSATDFLRTLGVRFVVVPDGSGAARYAQNAVLRVRFNSTAIYEVPGAHMKEYGDREVVELGK